MAVLHSRLDAEDLLAVALQDVRDGLARRPQVGRVEVAVPVEHLGVAGARGWYAAAAGLLETEGALSEALRGYVLAERKEAIARVAAWDDVPADAVLADYGDLVVLPGIVDTHVHLRQTREELVEDLRQRAYWGVGAAMSLGSDEGDVAFAVRGEEIPGAARYRTAGRGITGRRLTMTLDVFAAR